MTVHAETYGSLSDLAHLEESGGSISPINAITGLFPRQPGGPLTYAGLTDRLNLFDTSVCTFEDTQHLGAYYMQVFTQLAPVVPLTASDLGFGDKPDPTEVYDLLDTLTLMVLGAAHEASDFTGQDMLRCLITAGEVAPFNRIGARYTLGWAMKANGEPEIGALHHEGLPELGVWVLAHGLACCVAVLDDMSFLAERRLHPGQP